MPCIGEFRWRYFRRRLLSTDELLAYLNGERWEGVKCILQTGMDLCYALVTESNISWADSRKWRRGRLKRHPTQGMQELSPQTRDSLATVACR
ncbi:hypothetical protein LSTR_LSTR009651 [Laodelphax striatellus]|uniref:Uncharacterized protein n=1 Tax=Laodelphax striatellus TaxID=195883 RepID=A0A482WNC0_LAOST|nr:hypothetical protein LSTR_LSTR009651 [Laodelphax striatellus]